MCRFLCKSITSVKVSYPQTTGVINLKLSKKEINTGFCFGGLFLVFFFLLARNHRTKLKK